MPLAVKIILSIIIAIIAFIFNIIIYSVTMTTDDDPGEALFITFIVDSLIMAILFLI